jgi:hypothetical protein
MKGQLNCEEALIIVRCLLTSASLKDTMARIREHHKAAKGVLCNSSFNTMLERVMYLKGKTGRRNSTK